MHADSRRSRRSKKERHAHDGARFELRRLLPAGRGIAAHARVRLDDLELDVRRCRDRERHAIPEHHVAGDAVLEPDGGLAHGLLAGRELLERVRHHEVPESTVVVEILHLRLDHVGRFDGISGLEVSIERAPGLEIADPHAIERLPFAGLDELVLDNRKRVAVEDDLET
jgi:hypothetical protein